MFAMVEGCEREDLCLFENEFHKQVSVCLCEYIMEDCKINVSLLY